MGAIVEATGLTKYYGQLLALDHIDFSIDEGECFGFLGPNGAGKTTAMRIISCFYPPTSGKVTVFGMDVTENPSKIKARMGIAPQDDSLDPDFTVMENLVVYARYYDIPKRVSLPKARELLEFFGLSDKADTQIKALSGGMKRKLILARGLINNPELLLLDEPTTGLDPRSRHTVWDNITRLKYEGATVIITTHYMEEAQHLCDRVAIVDRGRIISVDTPSALIEANGVRDLEELYLSLTGKSLAAWAEEGE